MSAFDVLDLEKVTCPECDKTTDGKDWKDVYPYCETCGDHQGLECPVCGMWFDLVWDEDRLVDNSQ